MRESYEISFSDSVLSRLAYKDGNLQYTERFGRVAVSTLVESISHDVGYGHIAEPPAFPLMDTLEVSLLQASKTSFSNMGKEYSALRGLINPYECLGKGPARLFLNRSAMKMVNLDSIFGLVDTSITSSPFSFLDLCGGPGRCTQFSF